MITREMIEARLEKLRTEKAQLEANVHAYEGAIQEAEHWLEMVDEDEADPQAA